jgi:hypothetical protein
MTLSSAWPVLRQIIIDNQSFNNIKSLCGSAGMQVQKLSHLQQKSGFASSTKGQLMDGVDKLFNELSTKEQENVIRNLLHDLWHGSNDVKDPLANALERVGWGITEGEPHPLELQVNLEMAQLPKHEQKLISKSLNRYRQGDLDGAITSICSVVDSITEQIYTQQSMSDHKKDSYQQRVNRSFKHRESEINQILNDENFPAQEVTQIWDNLKGAINRAAYVLGAFRRNVSDVHGASNSSPQLVQQALDAAVFIIRNLI